MADRGEGGEADRSLRVTVIAEQLRHAIPGGIGTYVRGLLRGLGQVEPGSGIDASTWVSRLPVAIRTRLWDRGVGAVDGEVVHAPSLAFPRTRGRLVVMVHDLAWRDAPETFPKGGRRWHERAFARARSRADHFVVPSMATADRVMAAGVDGLRVSVIEEGCDHLPAPDHPAAAAVVDGEFILTVSTRQPRKNLVRLVGAYERARSALPEHWPLVVVGPPGWGREDERHDDVIFTGFVADATLAALYARARAFVYVPLVEGFGLPPVEAMHAGTPVVTSTAVPSTAGVAIEVDPYDLDAIAEAILAAATDDVTRTNLIARGSARASTLTWRVAAERHIELWKQLAGR